MNKEIAKLIVVVVGFLSLPVLAILTQEKKDFPQYQQKSKCVIHDNYSGRDMVKNDCVSIDANGKLHY